MESWIWIQLLTTIRYSLTDGSVRSLLDLAAATVVVVYTRAQLLGAVQAH